MRQWCVVTQQGKVCALAVTCGLRAIGCCLGEWVPGRANWGWGRWLVTGRRRQHRLVWLRRPGPRRAWPSRSSSARAPAAHCDPLLTETRSIVRGRRRRRHTLKVLYTLGPARPAPKPALPACLLACWPAGLLGIGSVQRPQRSLGWDARPDASAAPSSRGD